MPVPLRTVPRSWERKYGAKNFETSAQKTSDIDNAGVFRQPQPTTST